jgi:hypothetical protein
MADNVAITAGVGTSIATDDISSVHYQRFKWGVGPDGKYTEIQPASKNGLVNSTVDTTVASSSGILLGVSFFTLESAGSGGIRVLDSTSSSTGSNVLGAWLSTGAGARRSESLWFGPQGVKFNSGLRVVSNTTVAAYAICYYISPA